MMADIISIQSGVQTKVIFHSSKLIGLEEAKMSHHPLLVYQDHIANCGE